jgi:MFS transporter, DHA2 family, multidrug resistance protein
MGFSRTADPMAAPPASTPVQAPHRSLSVAPDSAAYKWWVTATVMLSAFLMVVSGSAMNVALPPIMTTFSLNLDQAQWILTAYMIAGAVLIPTVGWLGNRLGNRNLFLLSLLIFVGSSMLCGIAWSGPTLIFSACCRA